MNFRFQRMSRHEAINTNSFMVSFISHTLININLRIVS